MRASGMEEVITPTFQPVVSLSTQQPLYFEALMRATARRDHRDLLSFAEGYGFIQMIDAAMVSAVAKSLQLHPKVRIGVNLSVITVERFCGQLVAAIYDHLDVAKRLVIEITETMPITDSRAVRTFITAARAAGAAIAFDDFGTGHFTLEQVRRFSPDIVKLAEPLVAERHARRGEIDQLLEVASQMNIDLVAEAVDTEEKRSDCEALGIGYVQGFLVGGLMTEPIMPADSRVVTPFARTAAGG